VVSQDCTLAYADSEDLEPRIEIRPVLNDDPPSQRGIRSRKLWLEGNEYLDDASPHVLIAPRVLTRLLLQGAIRDATGESRTLALKLWLGKRYDRPAVPDALIPLAQRLAEEVKRKRHRGQAMVVRDVLFRADTDYTPPRIRLYALVEKPEDREPTRVWLAEIAMSIPTNLGVVDEFESGTSDDFAISVLENSYSADVSDVTWGQGFPVGAS
jgi:hypothetical protein